MNGFDRDFVVSEHAGNRQKPGKPACEHPSRECPAANVVRPCHQVQEQRNDYQGVEKNCECHLAREEHTLNSPCMVSPKAKIFFPFLLTVEYRKGIGPFVS